MGAVVFWQKASDIQSYGLGYLGEPVGILDTLGALHVDLTTGVVPTPDAIGGRTCLVDRPKVDRLLRRCWRHGRTIVWLRHPPRRRDVGPALGKP